MALDGACGWCLERRRHRRDRHVHAGDRDVDLRETASSGAPDAGTFVFWTGSGSYPVVGDWDANDTDTVGVKNGVNWSSNNQNDTSAAEVTFAYGLANDLPLTWKPGPTPRQQCEQALAAAGLTAPPNANYMLGTLGNDLFFLTAGNDVICGFAGADYARGDLSTNDIFIGGDGNDFVSAVDGGTFNGGTGDDYTQTVQSGTFNGGGENDSVAAQEGGTFNGDTGDDVARFLSSGTFDGGADTDALLSFCPELDGRPSNVRNVETIGGCLGE